MLLFQFTKMNNTQIVRSIISISRSTVQATCATRLVRPLQPWPHADVKQVCRILSGTFSHAVKYIN